MSYSTAEAKVAEVVNAINAATLALKTIRTDSERVITKLSKAMAGAASIEAEIDTEADLGSALWLRLQARKNQVKADMVAIRASAETIESGISSNLP